MTTALEVTGLRKAYGKKTAVDGLSLRVAEGEIFGILGPNGAGKTTTVECAEGLRRPDGGSIRVFGRPGCSSARSCRSCGASASRCCCFPSSARSQPARTSR